MAAARVPAWLAGTGAGLGGVAVAAVLGGWYGPVVGVLAALPLYRALRRLAPPAARRERQRAAAELPYLADLLAAALIAGLPVGRAVQVVAVASSGPAARRLARIGRGVALGLPPAQAWAPLGDVPGGPRLIAAVTRSADSGAALAGAFGRLADDLRTARRTGAEAAAHRAGVLIVLPLGLCFLPAFVFAGVVPVIVAVLGDVLR